MTPNAWSKTTVKLCSICLLLTVIATGLVHGQPSATEASQSVSSYSVVFDAVVPGGLSAPPAFDGSLGRLYLAGMDRFVLALGVDGTRHFQVDLGLRPAAFMACAADGSVLMVTDRDTMIRVNRAGRIVDRIKLDRTDGTGTYALSQTGMLLQLNGRTVVGYSPVGTPLWEIELPRTPSAPLDRVESSPTGETSSERLDRWIVSFGSQDPMIVSSDGWLYTTGSQATAGEPDRQGASLPISVPEDAVVHRLYTDSVVIVAYPSWRVTILMDSRLAAEQQKRVTGKLGGDEATSERPVASPERAGQIPGDHPIASYARTALARPDRTGRERLLSQIESRIGERRLNGLVDTAIAVAAVIGREVVNRPMQQGRLILNDYPDLRVRAARVLGEISTPGARDVLETMIARDIDTAVVGAAVEARSRYPLIGDGGLFGFVQDRFQSQTRTAERTRTASAGLQLARTFGEAYPEEAQTMLLLFSQADIPVDLRREALRLARQLGR